MSLFQTFQKTKLRTVLLLLGGILLGQANLHGALPRNSPILTTTARSTPIQELELDQSVISYEDGTLCCTNTKAIRKTVVLELFSSHNYGATNVKRWKIALYKLEKNKQWSQAIDLLQQQIERTPNNPHPWMYLQFLIMNLIVEEPRSPQFNVGFYEEMGLQCFRQAYAKFSHDPEYLFFTGFTAHMSVWLWNIENEDAQKMLDTALKLEPHNPVYQWNYYNRLGFNHPGKGKEAVGYARMMILNKRSPLVRSLKSHGILGERLLGIMQCWSRTVIHKFEHGPCLMCKKEGLNSRTTGR